MNDNSDVLPLVSISIISYNQIDFIRETLNSALEQDYPKLEVVIADDGSTDGTADIILEYAKEFPDRLIPLVGGPNLGITGNSNRALGACRGKYIAFQGGDDVLLPGKISAQVEWLERSSDRVLCGHQIEVFYEDSNVTHAHKRTMVSGKGSRWLIRNGNPYGATAVMVRASAVPAHGFNENLPQVSDGYMWIECLLGGGEFGFVEGVLARYRKHSNNFTNDKEPAILELEKMFCELELHYPDFTSDCRVGRANQLYYGLGVNHLNNKSYGSAFKFLLMAMKGNPINMKIYYRYAQILKNILFG